MKQQKKLIPRATQYKVLAKERNYKLGNALEQFGASPELSEVIFRIVKSFDESVDHVVLG